MLCLSRMWLGAVAVALLAATSCAVPPEPHSATERAIVVAPGPATPSVPAEPAVRTEEPVRALVPQDAHSVEATAVAYRPDGRFLATGGFDGSVRVWDATGIQRAQLFCDGEYAREIAWSPSGEAIAASCGGQVWIWDAHRALLRAHFGENVIGFAWSPDGARIACVGRSEEATRAPALDIYSTTSGERMTSATLPAPARQLVSVAWSPDGKTLASATLDGEGIEWDAATLKHAKLPAGVAGKLAYSPEGAALAANGPRGLVVMDVATRALRPLAKAGAFAWRADGRVLAVGEPESGPAGAPGGGRVELRDATSGALLGAVVQRRGVERIAFAPDGRAVALVGVDDPIVRVLDVADNRERLALGKGAGVERNHVSVSPDGELLAVSGATVELWSAKTGALVHVLAPSRPRYGTASFSPDGRYVVAAVSLGAANVWRTDTGAVEVTLLAPNPQQDSWHFAWRSAATGARTELVAGVDEDRQRWSPGAQAVPLPALGQADLVTELVWSPDGATLAIGGSRSARLIDTGTWHERLRIALDSWGWSYEPVWSADSASLLTGAGPYAQLWRTRDGALVGSAGPRGMFVSPVLSADGTWLGFAGESGVELWPTRSLPASAPARGHAAASPSGSLRFPFAARARALALTADARLVAASSDTRDVVVWDRASTRTLVHDRGHEGRVWSLAWHPNGSVLASASTIVRLVRASDGAAVTLRSVELAGGRRAAYVHSDGGHVTGDATALATLRFRSDDDVLGKPPVTLEEARALAVDEPGAGDALERPALMTDFWAGRPLDATPAGAATPP